MPWLVLFLVFFAASFWEAKDLRSWTDEELRLFFEESPWALGAVGGGQSAGAVETFLATALPVREAERELHRRTRKPEDNDALWDEYQEFLKSQGTKTVVLAVRLPSWNELAEPGQAEQMEKETLLKIHGRKYRLVGHFPPTPSDPYLRLVFPREVRKDDKSLRFELYVPGSTAPFREVEYRFKDLTFRGKPEF